MAGLFARAIVYARIRSNRIELRRIDTQQDISLVAEAPFSHERALLGNFTNADRLMKKGLSQLKSFRPPVVVVHPLELIQGGLTEIEQRAYQELAVGAGAAKAILWTGHELSDAEVAEKAAA